MAGIVVYGGDGGGSVTGYAKCAEPETGNEADIGW